MTSTRLASTTTTLGFGEPGQRNRVDPVKLLALINRIKTASEDTWESMLAEGEKIHKAFVHSFNYFKSQLK